MLDAVQKGVLIADEACTDSGEDFSGEEKAEDENDNEETESRSDYNVTILKQVGPVDKDRKTNNNE